MIMLGALIVAPGCGGTSPTSASSSGVPFTMTLSPLNSGIPFRVTLNGQSYTAEGSFSVRLPPGTHTLSGSYTAPGQFFGEGVLIGFGMPMAVVASGGVRSGSLQVMSGSVLDRSACHVVFGNFVASGPQAFQLQFEVTTATASACQIF